MAAQEQKLKNKAKTIPAKRRHKRRTIILVLIVVLALGITSTVVALNLINPKKAEQTTEQQAPASDHTDMTNGKSTDDAQALGSTNEAANKTPAQYEGENPNNYDSLTGIITFAGVSEGQFMISVSIDQFVTGNCSFEAIGPNGETIVADVKIMAGPSSSFCSYSGPIPETHGKYSIKVTPTSENKTGAITGEVEL